MASIKKYKCTKPKRMVGKLKIRQNMQCFFVRIWEDKIIRWTLKGNFEEVKEGRYDVDALC